MLRAHTTACSVRGARTGGSDFRYIVSVTSPLAARTYFGLACGRSHHIYRAFRVLRGTGPLEGLALAHL